MRDEGRPVGVGLPERASNRLKLHGVRALMVSVAEKSMAEDRVRFGAERRAQTNYQRGVENRRMISKLGAFTAPGKDQE